jgi:hypothetical protein
MLQRFVIDDASQVPPALCEVNTVKEFEDFNCEFSSDVEMVFKGSHRKGVVSG